MSDLLDTVSQVVIAVFGVLAILLVAKKNKWGFVAGLLSQPFWFYTSYHHRQWGVFALNFAYTGTWLVGIYEWFKDKPLKLETK
jgi:nicotinamide riboside transporter PnuC